MKTEVRRIGSGTPYWEDEDTSERTVICFAPDVEVCWVGVEPDLVTITTRLREPVKIEYGSVNVGDYDKEERK